jgi:L-fuculokinase
MKPQPVIAIFDIGKTNKKCFLFNEAYELVHEQSRRIEEISDEDDFPCDDLQVITSFMREAIAAVQAMPQFRLKAINFSGYGASFVHIDASGHPVTPLYNYLKPFPRALQQDFYARYGGEETFSKLTASPVLGSLNSGMQILRIKKEKPAVYSGIRYSLHLPQYLSFVFTGEAAADLTSIGCHTNLWDFTKSDYHQWIYEEGIDQKFPPIKNGDSVVKVQM